MLQQMLLWSLHSVLSWAWSWEVPDLVWTLLGMVSRGMSAMIGWTPAIPYVPYDVLSIGIQAWAGVYIVLSVLSGVTLVFEWIRGK